MRYANWWAQVDSPASTIYLSDAGSRLLGFSLAGEPLTPLVFRLMGPEGLEPSTPVLSGLCSNQLSYGPEFMCNDKCVTCNALIHYTFYITPYTITREPLLLWFLIWKIWLPY